MPAAMSAPATRTTFVNWSPVWLPRGASQATGSNTSPRRARIRSQEGRGGSSVETELTGRSAP